MLTIGADPPPENRIDSVVASGTTTEPAVFKIPASQTPSMPDPARTGDRITGSRRVKKWAEPDTARTINRGARDTTTWADGRCPSSEQDLMVTSADTQTE